LGVFSHFKLKQEMDCFPEDKVPGHQVVCFLVTLSKNEKLIITFVRKKNIKSLGFWGVFGHFQLN
jgi:hypothetical protein